MRKSGFLKKKAGFFHWKLTCGRVSDPWHGQPFADKFDICGTKVLPGEVDSRVLCEQGVRRTALLVGGSCGIERQGLQVRLFPVDASQREHGWAGQATVREVPRSDLTDVRAHRVHAGHVLFAELTRARVLVQDRRVGAHGDGLDILGVATSAKLCAKELQVAWVHPLARPLQSGRPIFDSEKRPDVLVVAERRNQALRWVLRLLGLQNPSFWMRNPSFWMQNPSFSVQNPSFSVQNLSYFTLDHGIPLVRTLTDVMPAAPFVSSHHPSRVGKTQASSTESTAAESSQLTTGFSRLCAVGRFSPPISRLLRAAPMDVRSSPAVQHAWD